METKRMLCAGNWEPSVAKETNRMLCEGDWDSLISPRRLPRRRSRRSRRPGSHLRARLFTLALLGMCLPVGGNFAADPTVPGTPSAPTVPAGPGSVPAGANGAAPGSATIPGYGPGEGLPAGPGDVPEMELIPPGIVPLQPPPNVPNLNLDLGPTPLVPQAPTAPELKDLKYKVSKFTIKYGPTKRPPHPQLPPAQSLLDTSLTLGQAAGRDGIVGAGAGERDLPVVLSQVKTAETYSGDALQAIYQGIVAQINKLGIYGVFVVVDPDQINPSTGEDLRQGKTELTLLVYASEVRQVRTIVKPVAKPPFKTASTIVDDPKYAKITAGSPLKSAPAKNKPGSLLERGKLQDYLDRINRFPGRRVDVAVTASGEDAGVILDYIVHVEHPGVFLFNQTSNTGSEASGSWRTRIGGEIRQLTGLDDTLDLSFETSLSTATYSAFGSYQITPIFPDVLKLKVYGGYGKFQAEDVGFDQAKFLGKSGTAGLLAIYTPLYFKGFPLDLIVGVEYKNVDITNVGFQQQGQTSFLLPLAGIATDKTTEQFAAFGSMQIQANLPDVIGTESKEIKNMGRDNVSRDFVIGKYNFGLSMYLEPLLFSKQWSAYQEEADVAKRRGMWKKLTLSHEIAALVHGQYTFGERRLIPQFEDVIGGFASVRGYPEAFTSGDNSAVLNAEYRFHLPKALKPLDTDQPPDDPSKPPPPAPKFALKPPTILGRPDLDIVLRGFFDLGYVQNNRLDMSTEEDRLLMSAGAGIEVQVLRYLNLRLDCGFALRAVGDKTSRPVEVGDHRLSFVGVISY